jgi:hypothetical protein
MHDFDIRSKSYVNVICTVLPQLHIESKNDRDLSLKLTNFPKPKCFVQIEGSLVRTRSQCHVLIGGESGKMNGWDQIWVDVIRTEELDIRTEHHLYVSTIVRVRRMQRYSMHIKCIRLVSFEQSNIFKCQNLWCDVMRTRQVFIMHLTQCHLTMILGYSVKKKIGYLSDWNWRQNLQFSFIRVVDRVRVSFVIYIINF